MRLETAYSACLRSWVTTVVRWRFPISGVIPPTPGGCGAVDNDTSRPGTGSDARLQFLASYGAQRTYAFLGQPLSDSLPQQFLVYGFAGARGTWLGQFCHSPLPLLLALPAEDFLQTVMRALWSFLRKWESSS